MSGILDDAWGVVRHGVRHFVTRYSFQNNRYGPFDIDFLPADRDRFLDLPQISIRFQNIRTHRIFIDPIVQDPCALIYISHQIMGGKWGTWISRESDCFNFHAQTSDMAPLKTFVDGALQGRLDHIASWNGLGSTREYRCLSQSRPSSP